MTREAREARAKAAPTAPLPSSAPTLTSVAVIPTLEQCGPTVRFWSDVCGITDHLDNSTNRSVLAAESIDSIVAALGNMYQMERAGLYVGLIRFMGILWADIMRSITIIENQDDMESLLQTSMRSARVSSHEIEEIGLVQTFSRTTPVTLFASKVLQLQAHFDSMTPEKAARISKLMQSRLMEWRQRWTLSVRSVSRDRVERLCAVLAAFEMEDYEGEAQAEEVTWASTQWSWVAPYLEADAVANCGDADTVPDDTLPPTQVGGATGSGSMHAGQACGSGDVLVQRKPQGPWEPATEAEQAELEKHDEEVKQEQLQQQQHDAWLWSKVEEQKEQERRASQHQAWEDWVVGDEMAKSPGRPTKRFRLQVAVVDKDGNELATADLRGPTGANDTPQVNFVMSMESMTEGPLRAGSIDVPQSEATTEPVNQVPDPLHMYQLEELEDIVSSTMCREWFRLWCDGQVDDDMVVNKWGQQVLDTFVINRAMVEMDTAAQVDKDLVNTSLATVGLDASQAAGCGQAAGALSSASSCSGGDSNAGCSDANLESRCTLPQGSAPSQVDPPETQLMDIDGEEATVAAEAVEDEGGQARAASTVEGQHAQSTAEHVQSDLKHWLK